MMIRTSLLSLLSLLAISAWSQTGTVLHHEQSPVYALASSELDGTDFSEEIVALVSDGRILQVQPADGSVLTLSETEDPIGSMSNRPSLSIGNVIGTEAPDIFACGNNLVRVLYTDGTTLQEDVVYDITGYLSNLWGARAGDYDTRRPGDEIFVINETVFDFSIGEMVYSTDTVWSTTTIYEAEVGMDSATGDFDPSRPGDDTVIVTEMGRTYQLLNPFLDSTLPDPTPWEGGWTKRLIWEDAPDGETPDDSGWVVRVGDVDPTRDGNEVVYGTRYNNRVLISWPVGNEDRHEREVILQGERDEHPWNMWDIAIGDVLPDVGGMEVVAVDEGGHVYLVWHDGTAWQNRIVWKDEGPLYAVTVLEADPNRPGREIVVAGERGEIRLLDVTEASFANHWMQFR